MEGRTGGRAATAGSFADGPAHRVVRRKVRAWPAVDTPRSTGRRPPTAGAATPVCPPQTPPPRPAAGRTGRRRGPKWPAVRATGTSAGPPRAAARGTGGPCGEAGPFAARAATRRDGAQRPGVGPRHGAGGEGSGRRRSSSVGGMFGNVWPAPQGRDRPDCGRSPPPTPGGTPGCQRPVEEAFPSPKRGTRPRERGVSGFRERSAAAGGEAAPGRSYGGVSFFRCVFSPTTLCPICSQRTPGARSSLETGDLLGHGAL